VKGRGNVIKIRGIKAKALAALYNNSKPLGMGIMQYDPRDMTEQEAATILIERQHFDYLKGRVMKVDLSGNFLDPRLYDRDNGEGAAAAAVASVLS